MSSCVWSRGARLLSALALLLLLGRDGSPTAAQAPGEAVNQVATVSTPANGPPGSGPVSPSPTSAPPSPTVPAPAAAARDELEAPASLLPPTRTPRPVPTSWIAPPIPTATATASPTPTATETPTLTAVPSATATNTAVPMTPVPTALHSGERAGWSAGAVFVPTLAFSPSPARLTSPTATATPRRELPQPPPIRYAGVPTSSAEAKWLDDRTLWLGIPHRTQFEDSIYAQSNCGPASLGMILTAYGLTGYATDALRGEVNRLQGNFDPNEGTSLPALAAVAQRAGLHPVGLYSRPGAYRRWTIDDIREQVKAGRPVITLARYADLPGNGHFPLDTNHYIVISGLAGDNLIYNDSAYIQGQGRALTISPEALLRAWANSVIPGHAVAFALNAEGHGLIGLKIERPPESWEIEEEAQEPGEEALDEFDGPRMGLLVIGGPNLTVPSPVPPDPGADPALAEPPLVAAASLEAGAPGLAVPLMVLVVSAAFAALAVHRRLARRPSAAGAQRRADGGPPSTGD